MLTLDQIAAQLSVSTGTIKTWHHAGLITGHPYNDKGQCLYPPPGPNPQPAHKNANSANDAPPPPPPLTTPNPAKKCQTHRYHLHQDNIRTPRSDPERCSTQPEVSSAGPVARSVPPRSRRR
jgi:hypothetical protein